jgi:hypothetical protein
MAAAQQWHHGILYPHWLEEANFGAGEPRFVFYPPLTWMLGAILGTIMPWSAAPVAFTLIILAASGLTMNKLASRWLPPAAATIAACAYILNPYALFVTYERTAYGELAAAIWLPLIVLYGLRIGSRPHHLVCRSRSHPTGLNKNCHPERSLSRSLRQTESKDLFFQRSPFENLVPLTLTIAAIWLTNAPAAVMATYTLGAIALWQSITTRRYQPILQSAISLILGLSLAAFYLVPAACERRWVDIARAIGPGMRIEDSCLFGHTGESFHDQVLRTASWIFVTMLATIALAGWMAWMRRASNRLLKHLFVTAALLFGLQLPITAFLWNHAPELKFLQFPWRFSLVLSIVFAITIGMSVPFRPSRSRPIARTALSLAIIIAAVATGSWLFWQPCDDEDVVSAQLTVFNSGAGFEGTDEYTPIGADNSEIPQGLPPVRVLKSADDEIAPSTDPDQETPPYTPNPRTQLAANIQIAQWQTEKKAVTITTQGPGYAVLRLMDYPAWQVRTNGTEAGNRPHRDDGLMAIPIDTGKNRIEIAYKATPDVLLGRSLTAAALLSLIVLLVLCRLPQKRVPHP